MKDVLDVQEAADLLGVSVWTVRDAAKKGAIPARKVGRAWRFSRTALLAVLGLAHGGRPHPFFVSCVCGNTTVRVYRDKVSESLMAICKGCANEFCVASNDAFLEQQARAAVRAVKQGRGG